MINDKNKFLTGSWLSGVLSAEISTGEWGGPDANTDRLKQPISAGRVSGGFPGNAISQTIFEDTLSWMKNFVFWLKFHW